MARVRIGPTGAATVGRLLREVSTGDELAGGLSSDANHWAPLLHHSMERRDVEQVAWLLRNLSAARALPVFRQDRARYWAAYLEGRL